MVEVSGRGGLSSPRIDKPFVGQVTPVVPGSYATRKVRDALLWESVTSRLIAPSSKLSRLAAHAGTCSQSLKLGLVRCVPCER